MPLSPLSALLHQDHPTLVESFKIVHRCILQDSSSKCLAFAFLPWTSFLCCIHLWRLCPLTPRPFLVRKVFVFLLWVYGAFSLFFVCRGQWIVDQLGVPQVFRTENRNHQRSEFFLPLALVLNIFNLALFVARILSSASFPLFKPKPSFFQICAHLRLFIEPPFVLWPHPFTLEGPFFS